MSAFLADTNVISEEAKPRPSEKVVAWMTGASKSIYISSVVVAEIHRGIADLPLSAPRRALLSAWLADRVESVYAGRILPMDVAVAKTWLSLTREKKMERADSVIAATALARGLVLATRNIRHFQGVRGLKIFNPWDL